MVGSGVQSLDASAIRWAVCTAVPDGASSLFSWCSSMISAESKYGAATSAKCIIRTAPIAKLGAMTQFERVNIASKAAMSSSVNPVVPTTAWTPCSAHHLRLSIAAARWLKSTTTWTAPRSRAAGPPAMRIPASTPVTVRRSRPE